ncbi:hypothetical protein Shyd_55440 [Streptomyces hydrogenans]|uniref:DUF2797 domain-containing protein n=1 Tax=Streptomyces hydrogenans TaxID=1873719 RepID=A0ABQ3PGM2_9ACTN|nr:hypothetical protein Shyd_55440 [Streptomyces hydrogenans]
MAADTFADDPRPYRVYLAWFGPGTVKVGITGEHRGSARLLEQGAVAFCWLGRGPLMAARRTEEVLRQALGVPDRVSYDRKRALRIDLPDSAARAAEIEELYGRALGVGGWGETLEALPFAAHDHGEVFGLGGLPALDGTVTELVDGGVVTVRVLDARRARPPSARPRRAPPRARRAACSGGGGWSGAGTATPGACRWAAHRGGRPAARTDCSDRKVLDPFADGRGQRPARPARVIT